MNSMYVFPKYERLRFICGYISVFISSIFFEIIVIYKYLTTRNQTIILVNVLVVLMFAMILLVPIKYIKYRFSKCVFGTDSVSIVYKDVLQTINRNDNYSVSIMTMLYAGRYYNTPAKFAVIWLKDASIPVDDISPYVAMRKYNAIVLPCDQKNLDMIYTSLGVDHIPNYPEIYHN